MVRSHSQVSKHFTDIFVYFVEEARNQPTDSASSSAQQINNHSLNRRKNSINHETKISSVQRSSSKSPAPSKGTNSTSKKRGRKYVSCIKLTHCRQS